MPHDDHSTKVASQTHNDVGKEKALSIKAGKHVFSFPAQAAFLVGMIVALLLTTSLILLIK